MKKTVNIIVTVIIIIVVLSALWYFFIRQTARPSITAAPNQIQNGFVPFNRALPANNSGQNENGGQNNGTTTTTSNAGVPLPVIRQLSATPVGGYAASTTASTTVVRWIDRGRGNIYEARGDSLDITTISNTLLPRVYQSWWNKDDTTFVGQYLGDNSDQVTTVIANVLKRALPKPTVNLPTAASANASSTASSSMALNSTAQLPDITETPYELKGKIVSGDILAVAASPKRDKILVVTDENDSAVGYISNFDGSKQTQLFSLPFTQLTVEWPEANTIAVTTKASAYYSGYLYFVNVKTGVVKQIMGDIKGLATRVSKDATKVLYSSYDGNNKITTAVYDIKSGKSAPTIFRTLADKCVWSAVFKEQVYCGVSSQIPAGTYPDSWYLGQNSFIDSIWLLDADTGQVRQVADLLNQGNAIIDAFNLQLDENDQYLFFMNKNDLSLWSLDLVSSN
ncbi:hypothetical protein KGQ27_00230 [Patescibacteria group bacterium]|nr:hypothetical protein [Patescibacteria group bacterium]MDE1946643.1 hypothetical protein [Patescibacteria group bacterium]MDE2010596.1 hypothetical protein [Patescibacteria group bacterium]MDE2232957.1 hypothetical protein [Patescibacteria group bacterium]